MALETRADFKAATIDAIYTNTSEDVEGDDIQDRINALADSAIIQEFWEDMASATTVQIATSDSNFVRITGTTAITGFGASAAAGFWRKLRFNAALTLTHGASAIIIPGGVNITTAAGDLAEVLSEGSGVWRVLSYTRADGAALAIGSATPADGVNNPATGELSLWSRSLRVLQLLSVSSAVNYLSISNKVTGADPTITAAGSDTDIGIRLISKGVGSISFFTGGGEQFRIVDAATAVNRLQATGAAAGAAPSLRALGSDTDIDIILNPKGAGAVRFPGGLLLRTAGNLTNGAAAQTATMTNGPTTGNPTKWVPIDDNGTTRYIPMW